jgi:hypothetical protein
VMCSNVSIASTRMKGVDVFVVARKGRGRLKPQSPLAREDWGVVIVWWIGCGNVAESDVKMAWEERSLAGRGSGGGIENTLEALSRAPPGDILRDAIVASWIVGR